MFIFYIMSKNFVLGIYIVKMFTSYFSKYRFVISWTIGIIHCSRSSSYSQPLLSAHRSKWQNTGRRRSRWLRKVSRWRSHLFGSWCVIRSLSAYTPHPLLWRHPAVFSYMILSLSLSLSLFMQYKKKKILSSDFFSHSMGSLYRKRSCLLV